MVNNISSTMMTCNLKISWIFSRQMWSTSKMLFCALRQCLLDSAISSSIAKRLLTFPLKVWTSLCTLHSTLRNERCNSPSSSSNKLLSPFKFGDWNNDTFGTSLLLILQAHRWILSYYKNSHDKNVKNFRASRKNLLPLREKFLMFSMVNMKKIALRADFIKLDDFSLSKKFYNFALYPIIFLQ